MRPLGMMHVFDMDGTLVDTRVAIKEAYRLAGINMPDDAFGRPWRKWCPVAVHQNKNVHYQKTIELASEMWCMGALRELVLLHRPVYILTGASTEAVHAVIRRFNIHPSVRFKAELSRHQKANWLLIHGLGVYVDDDAQTRVIVERKTQWKVFSPEAFRRLSWPPAPTLV